MLKQRTTPEEALYKARHFCGYRERCRYEVTEKLYGLGLHKQEVEKTLLQLTEDGYLNEDRFASMFAGGRFRVKKWGRVKIRYELKLKRVENSSIVHALSEINIEEYAHVLEVMARKKWNSLKNLQDYSRSAKTMQYLLSKGYEPGLISRALTVLKQG